MIISRLFLFIIILLFLFIPSSAFEDTFQDHPSDDLEQGDENNIWTLIIGLDTVTVSQNGPTYNKVMYFYAGATPFGYSQKAYNSYPDSSNYYSFITRSLVDTNYAEQRIYFYDSNGHIIGSYHDIETPLNTYNSNVLYEFVRSSNTLYLYIDGGLYGSLGSLDSSFSYVEIYNGKTSGGSGSYSYWKVDCVSFDGYVIGIGTDESPNTWINVNSNNEINVEWTVNTIDPYGTWNDTEVFQIRVTWMDAGTIVNTTTLDTTKPNGFVVYNRSIIMPDPNYGIYKFDLLKDSVVMGTEYLTFAQIGQSGTLSWDKVDYVPYQNASIAYAVTPYTPADYNYYIRTYEINTGLVDTNTITANSGTMTESLDTWATGSYYSLLTVVDKSDSSETTVAFDVFDINDEVRFEGYTYDAENGTILNETNVNFSQSSSWYNDTSNATALYELDGLSDSVQITLNASKTNFTHEDFTFTPPTAKLYTTNLYLFPTNRSLNGTSIVEGMTVDYPLHQALGSATVNLYNATWSNTTTSNAFGYYQFNLSGLVNGTYTVNATLSGYDNSSEYSITVTKNESTVQNIVLPTNYYLTVTAKDSTTSAVLSIFTANVNGESISTTNGSAVFSLSYGLYSASVSADNYYPGAYSNVLMNKNRSVEVSMSPVVTDYYNPEHNVKFTVWGLAGYYEDVDVSVYKYGESDTTFTAVTGTDGSVTFNMNETQRYTITFISSSQGINEEVTLYPVELSYLVFISSTSSWDEYSTPINEAIDIDVTTEIINSTAAYVNVSYNDTLQHTTAAIVYLNQTNNSDPYNQTVISSQDGFSNNWTHSFIVTNYTGESYYIHVVATHDTYGTIDKTYAVSFNDDIIFDGIPSKFFLYMSIFIMLFTGAMFGAQSVGQGSMIVCVEGWVFLAFGWFNSIDSGLIMTGLAFATVFSLIYLINQKQKKEGV